MIRNWIFTNWIRLFRLYELLVICVMSCHVMLCMYTCIIMWGGWTLYNAYSLEWIFLHINIDWLIDWFSYPRILLHPPKNSNRRMTLKSETTPVLRWGLPPAPPARWWPPYRMHPGRPGSRPCLVPWAGLRRKRRRNCSFDPDNPRIERSRRFDPSPPRGNMTRIDPGSKPRRRPVDRFRLLGTLLRTFLLDLGKVLLGLLNVQTLQWTVDIHTYTITPLFPVTVFPA